MSYKSRPEGWIVENCIGYCKLKSNCPGGCFNKSKFVDCRTDCINFKKKCDKCHNANKYKAVSYGNTNKKK